MRFSQLLITFTILIVSCTNINNELKTDSDLNNEVLNHIKFLSRNIIFERFRLLPRVLANERLELVVSALGE